MQISIHAPARGATYPAHPLLPGMGISIHAPARGATTAGILGFAGIKDFNPRSRKGSDCMELHTGVSSRPFQSTLPQGERHRVYAGGATATSDFNPRSRKGSDRNYNQFSHSTFIQNYHFLLHCLPSFIPKLSFPRYLTILCAIFPVRIPHRFYVCFRFAPDYKISVWSAAVPRSTPICSTFVWYLFPR